MKCPGSGRAVEVDPDEYLAQRGRCPVCQRDIPGTAVYGERDGKPIGEPARP